MDDYMREYTDKYIDLISVLVWKSKPKLLNDKLYMQFDCNAIKEWLHKNEPDLMDRWRLIQKHKLEGEDE